MAPAADYSEDKNMNGFELICSSKFDGIIPVHKYKSYNTGIKVVIAEVEGPIVCGYLSLGECLRHNLHWIFFFFFLKSFTIYCQN